MEDKRRIGEYTIILEVDIGDNEIVVGENPAAPDSKKYICAYVDSSGIFESLSECTVSGDYADILTVFGERVSEKAGEVQKMIEKERDELGGDKVIHGIDCNMISDGDDLEDKVVVLKESILRPEYRRGSYQLMLCNGGFGSKPYARGTTCFCTRLSDKFDTSRKRHHIIGVMPEDKLPEWAKSRLAEIRGARDERQRTKDTMEER